MQITDAAVFYSRLTKWPEHFDGLAEHTIQSQVYFRLAFEPQELLGQPGHFTVDVSDTLEAKMASIECYQTQFPPAKHYVFERVRAAAAFVGAAAGCVAGEVFATTRPITTQDFMGTLGVEPGSR